MVDGVQPWPAYFFGVSLSKYTDLVYNKICMAYNRLQPVERSAAGMDCKDAEKKIPYFLRDELDGNRLEEFVEHIENCSECREELSIQFLVSEGLERLEGGSNFNLQRELLTKMESAQRRINIHRMLWYVLVCLEAAVVSAIIISLCILLRM